ncbi:MAG: hypothetical protein Satyrvirus6_8 [Satyrvirus sp.]|uniref:Uncharacterized protein n=1 Tax=Satyrvirus sp. TaxID=2487771 RepID=A0A3G5AD82_9VIRU|nr:MAG: hypothetical protein Satyrvirus6_8 [Satyrvirus sp.]
MYTTIPEELKNEYTRNNQIAIENKFINEFFYDEHYYDEKYTLEEINKLKIKAKKKEISYISKNGSMGSHGDARIC